MPENLPMNKKGFSPFRDMVGAKFTRVENGYSQCVLEVNEKLMNPYRTVHGGAAFTMVDSGMGAALYSVLAENEICATIESQIIFFKPVSAGTLICDTRLVHRSKKIATLESEISNNGQVVARATGTWSIYRARKKG